MTVSFQINEHYTETFQIVNTFSEKSERSYKALRPGWTDVLYDVIVEQTRTRCIYQFERAIVVGDEFVADAICVECEGTLTAK